MPGHGWIPKNEFKIAAINWKSFLFDEASWRHNYEHIFIYKKFIFALAFWQNFPRAVRPQPWPAGPRAGQAPDAGSFERFSQKRKNRWRKEKRRGGAHALPSENMKRLVERLVKRGSKRSPWERGPVGRKIANSKNSREFALEEILLPLTLQILDGTTCPWKMKKKWPNGTFARAQGAVSKIRVVAWRQEAYPKKRPKKPTCASFCAVPEKIWR